MREFEYKTLGLYFAELLRFNTECPCFAECNNPLPIDSLCCFDDGTDEDVLDFECRDASCADSDDRDILNCRSGL